MLIIKGCVRILIGYIKLKESKTYEIECTFWPKTYACLIGAPHTGTTLLRALWTVSSVRVKSLSKESEKILCSVCRETTSKVSSIVCLEVYLSLRVRLGFAAQTNTSYLDAYPRNVWCLLYHNIEDESTLRLTLTLSHNKPFLIFDIIEGRWPIYYKEC